MDSQSRWQDWVKSAAGLWLFVSPWAIGVTGDSVSSWNAWIVGTVVLVGSLWALRAPKASWLQWVTGLAGLWMAISPALIVIASEMFWSAIITGALSVVLSLWVLLSGHDSAKKLSA